ncbi:MAG: cupredoxin domain-containing protein [Egibacteraceae bacterium]
MTITRHSTDVEAAHAVRPDRGWIRVLAWVSVAAAAADLAAPALVGEIIPPLATGAALTLVGLVLLRRYRRTGIAVLGITSLLLILTGAPFALPNLAHPASTITFVHAATLVVRLAAVAAAVGAWRHASPTGARRLGVAAAGLLSAAVVVGAVAAALTPSDSAQPGDVTVEARDFAFVPRDVRVTSGGSVYVSNADLILHTFSVESTALSQPLPERRRVRLRVELDPGTYQIFCAVPGHEAMTGVLVVE